MLSGTLVALEAVQPRTPAMQQVIDEARALMRRKEQSLETEKNEAVSADAPVLR